MHTIRVRHPSNESKDFLIAVCLGDSLRAHIYSWLQGFKLFKDDPTTNRITFIAGDIFNESFVRTTEPPTAVLSGSFITYPPLKSLKPITSLNPLLGKFSAIHASAFFHLFNEEQQLIVGRKLAALLSPEPGSVIFGSHAAEKEKGWIHRNSGGTDLKIFCHSFDSFKELWEKDVFGGDKGVEVEIGDGEPFQGQMFLNYCVKRVRS